LQTAIRQGTAGYDRDILVNMLQGKAIGEISHGFNQGAPQGTRRRPADREDAFSVVMAAIGTKNEIDTHDSILILEDADEKPYRIDGCLPN